MKLQTSIWILSSLLAIQASKGAAHGGNKPKFKFGQDCEAKSLSKDEGGHWILQAKCSKDSSATKTSTYLDLGECYGIKDEQLTLQKK